MWDANTQTFNETKHVIICEHEKLDNGIGITDCEIHMDIQISGLEIIFFYMEIIPKPSVHYIEPRTVDSINPADPPLTISSSSQILQLLA